MALPMTIADMQPDDWEAVCSIYAEGLATGLAAFRSSPPTWADWNAGHFPTCRLVARSAGLIAGFAVLSRTADA
jgi:phosphinothricin acetyltransferase